MKRAGIAMVAFGAFLWTSAAAADGGPGAKLAVNGGYGHIFSVPFYGVGFGAEVGGDIGKSLGIYGGIHYERARTEYGLPIHFGQLGVTVEGILDRFRVGGGIHFPYFSLERKSTSDNLDKFGIGLHVSATFDLVHTREFNLFLGVRPQIDLLGKDRTLNAHADFGVRF
ncbi:hypothetical protein LVJ94_08770 [Pendulispora rubella]|uniref:Outer membrane protein beta-barrel domain-containing protein n=1 Tax=Pendulispora rubella TaxID=2741070 RepID=A0ABZ2L8Q3_9BACT